MSTTQYGIGVTKNRFELADIYDEDPLEALKIQEQEREAKKKTKLSEKENKGKEPTLKPKAPAAPRPKGIKETQNLKPQEQKAKEGVSDKTRPPKVLADKSRAPRVERGTSGSNGANGGERKFSENREEVKNRRNREDRPQGDFHREDRAEKTERREYRGDRNEKSSFYGDSNTDNRGRGRGGRGFSGSGGGAGGRGGRGGRNGTSRPGFDSRGKREYDRQSGSDKTGVKSVDKREGSGAHNWGNHRDDLDDLNNPSPPTDDNQQNWSPEKPEQLDNSAGETNGTAVDGDENATPQEEERKELTLDEWKALKALKAPKQKPTFNLRKAGEGEDPSQWKKMYALQKKKDGEDEEEEEEYEYENCEYPQRVGRQKHILDIDIHFKDTRGGVRSRGNRGAGRGGPRMGTRGINSSNIMEKHSGSGRDNGQKIAPKVDDEHDFPSLG